MKVPLITDELVEFLEARYSEPCSRNDSGDLLRWKAAQRQVVDEMKQLNKQQKTGETGVNGIKVRSDD